METVSPILLGGSKAKKSYVNQIVKLKDWITGAEPIATTQKTMTSPPTITMSGTLNTSYDDLYWVATAGATNSNVMGADHFTFTKTTDVITNGATSTFCSNQAVKQTAAPVYFRSNWGVLFEHTGQVIQIKLNDQNSTPGSSCFLVKVNGEYISTTPQATGSGTRYAVIDFGSVATRRIEIIMEYVDTLFGGVYTIATDTITKVRPKGPKTVVIGDSFTASAGATTKLGGYCNYLGDFLDWEDICASGIASTGYQTDASGTKLTYADRVAHDVIAGGFECVIITGGINDAAASVTYASQYTAAVSLYNTIKAGLPNAVLIVAAPFWKQGGANAMSEYVDNVYRAVKDAAAAVGAIYVDLIEMSLNQTALSGTITENISAGGTSFKSATCFPPQSFVKIGFDRVHVDTVTHSLGIYTHNVFSGTIITAHTAGDAVTQVGKCLWTGAGKVGSTTGKGNCDLIVSSDGTHPSPAGHALLGYALANDIVRAVRAYEAT